MSFLLYVAGMKDYQREFLDYVIELGVLRFGEFTLKSGRLSPYFFNAGLFNSGSKLAGLGKYYAAAAKDADLVFDMLFGPAYKGIPLAIATAIAFHNDYQRDVPCAFNRKEAKTHAEGGVIVGTPLAGKVLIIDDVISSGISVKHAVDLIQTSGASASGVIIALDRQEKGGGNQSAVREVEQSLSLKVTSIVGLDTLTLYLSHRGGHDKEIEAINRYRDKYGC